jgi:L-ribulose-5-phosphate 4-epimerase
MKHLSTRKQLLDTVIKANEVDLIRISAGNISTRTNDGLVVITPSGVKYRDIHIEDLSIVDLNGNLVEGQKPSSETPMHTAIYRNLPKVNSVCHTHSTFAISFAMLGNQIPVANLELMVCGAPIPVAPWACPGTNRAGDVSVELFNARPGLKVILLRKHGLVSVGADLDQAFEMAFNAEVGLQAYYQALQIGVPEPITDEQIAEVRLAYQPK